MVVVFVVECSSSSLVSCLFCLFVVGVVLAIFNFAVFVRVVLNFVVLFIVFNSLVLCFVCPAVLKSFFCFVLFCFECPLLSFSLLFSRSLVNFSFRGLSCFVVFHLNHVGRFASP